MASQAVTEAIEQCERILEKCDDLPDEADDFARSISDKVNSIWKWIEARQHVTEKQLGALENIEAGVDRWLERSDEF